MSKQWAVYLWDKLHLLYTPSYQQFLKTMFQKALLANTEAWFLHIKGVGSDLRGTCQTEPCATTPRRNVQTSNLSLKKGNLSFNLPLCGQKQLHPAFPLPIQKHPQVS